MLMAPHQLAAAAYSSLKPHLPWWGACFLVGGAGLALISLSGGFSASSHLPGIANYAILGLGTMSVTLVPHRRRPRLLLGQDGCAAMIGLALLTQRA